MTLSKRERSFRVTCSDFRGCKNAVYAQRRLRWPPCGLSAQGRARHIHACAGPTHVASRTRHRAASAPTAFAATRSVTAACCCSCTGTRDTQGVVDEGVLRRTPAYSGALQGPTTAAHRRYLPSFVQSVQVLPGPCPKGCGSSRLELRMCARTPLSLSGTAPKWDRTLVGHVAGLPPTYPRASRIRTPDAPAHATRSSRRT